MTAYEDSSGGKGLAAAGKTGRGRAEISDDNLAGQAANHWGRRPGRVESGAILSGGTQRVIGRGERSAPTSIEAIFARCGKKTRDVSGVRGTCNEILKRLVTKSLP